ncbi:Xaa-Pro aminopeptidase [Brachionus plicatilis]|uniref:Xaa-Pro aminopeptidase n=1 Tax=Brachionus plicatilis TaxID=10195 RepID=A0A3M7PSW1_BRAPC|nr:Xaa-Pro aminopeptidase [Brachionus plicatilis]
MLLKFSFKLSLNLKEKIEKVQQKIKDSSAENLVVTALDEIAWLFNLRAEDVPNNPMFFAYAIIFADTSKNSHRLYIAPGRIDTDLKNYLNGVELRNYSKIFDDIKQDSMNNYKTWISPQSSFAIYNSITDKSLMINKPSPIRSLKARKNEVELKNLRECNIRDSVARIRHMFWLENEVKKGTVTEMTSAEKLEQIQREDPNFKMKSFYSISAVGKNAAVVHYSTSQGDNSKLTLDKIYLLDAGGNYLDCTSDITRTHFYGNPPSEIKDAYTKVLQGSINLANIVFPTGVYGRELDVLARSALWKDGLDYGHGTGHGIGFFLSVHENPPRTSYSSRSTDDEFFEPGMIQSDEPGFYEDGSYGIRLETDIETVKADTPAGLSMEEKLTKLRTTMKDLGFNAVIIPSEDEHQSEYVSKHDERRAWISGFTGSAGTAVVTEKSAALWTDSRYYIQAIKELDRKYWTQMNASESKTLKIEEWLEEQLSPGQKVARNAKLTSISSWQNTESQLSKFKLSLHNPNEDLVDLIWPSDERPLKPNTEIKIHDKEFAGKTWQNKVEEVRKKLHENGADLFVVTALDEVAWLFNLRAADIPYNPMLFAYAIVSNSTQELYIDQNRIKDSIKRHLDGVLMKDYDQIIDEIKNYSSNEFKIWISPMSSYAVYDAVSNKSLLVSKTSPVRSLKARKNPTEIENLKKCHIRDSAARVRHMHWMETQLKNGNKIDEKQAAKKLEEIQEEDTLFAMLSFDSIAAVGGNAAIVHYSTEKNGEAVLTNDKIFLLDAGANYQDGTTDITRTHFFGQPSRKIKLAYTKVLQGSINLAKVVFPTGVYGRSVDVEARKELWKSGLDYGHGTGHGIGYFLSVHEDPPSVSYNSRSTYDEALDIGMVLSDEPGYYEENEFGIRLETDLLVEEAKTEFSLGQRKNLKFSPLNYVPFDKNLIDECLLSTDQVDWLNVYNSQTRTHLSPLLDKYPEVKNYMMEKTEPFKYAHAYEYCPTFIRLNKSARLNSLPTTLLMILVSAQLIKLLF